MNWWKKGGPGIVRRVGNLELSKTRAVGAQVQVRKSGKWMDADEQVTLTTSVAIPAELERIRASSPDRRLVRIS